MFDIPLKTMLEWFVSMMFLPVLLTAGGAYLCGCFNGAVIVSKYILRDDVRNHGSGNAGLTNFYRTFGGGLTFAVIACDMLKAVAAVGLGVLTARLWDGGFWLGEPLAVEFFKYWAALFCLLGHMFPCMFQFRGGKGILSGGAAALMIDWRVALAVWGVFALFAVSTRYVSLGSCCAAAAFPIATWFVYQSPALTLLAAIAGGLILYMHRGNIKRLCSGTESKFVLRKKK